MEEGSSSRVERSRAYGGGLTSASMSSSLLPAGEAMPAVGPPTAGKIRPPPNAGDGDIYSSAAAAIAAPRAGATFRLRADRVISPKFCRDTTPSKPFFHSGASDSIAVTSE